MSEKRSIEDILTLVEQNFEFLHVGKFLSYYIKENNLSNEAKNLSISLGPDNSYLLRGDLIKDSLSNSFINGDKRNVLGYFTTWNAFRGIAAAMREGIKKNSQFKDFLESVLKDKYKHFECIISFLWNVLSHNIDNEIRLIDEDFKGTKKYCKQENSIVGEVAVFDFNYSHDYPEITRLPENYGFDITVDFGELKEGDKFIDIVSEWQLYMMMELCRNLVLLFRRTQLSNV